MTIAEQISRAKTDFDEVYEAGYDKGKSEGGNTEEAYNNGFETGKKAECDVFWDTFQRKGTRTKYDNAFYAENAQENGWADANYKPKYDFVLSSGIRMFYFAQITDVQKPITIKDGAGVSMLFAYSQIETIPLLRFEGDVQNFSNTFVTCGKLKNITIEGTIFKNISFGFSSLLTNESLMSIINALNDYSGTTTTCTLTLHSTVKARLSNTEKAIATQKGWTIA